MGRKKKKKSIWKKEFLKNNYVYDCVLLIMISCSLVGIFVYSAIPNQVYEQFSKNYLASNTSVSIDMKEIIKVGESVDAGVFPSKYNNLSIKWYTKDTSIISVDSITGRVYGKKAGEATVYVYIPTLKKTISRKIYVGCKLLITSYPEKLKVGSDKTITINYGCPGYNYKYKITSSDSNVIKVVNNRLYAKKKGTVKIKVEVSELKYSKTINVKVY